jgi:hypothetical protein
MPRTTITIVPAEAPGAWIAFADEVAAAKASGSWQPTTFVARAERMAAPATRSDAVAGMFALQDLTRACAGILDATAEACEQRAELFAVYAGV